MAIGVEELKSRIVLCLCYGFLFATGVLWSFWVLRLYAHRVNAVRLVRPGQRRSSDIEVIYRITAVCGFSVFL